MKKLLIVSCGGFIMLATGSVITPICLPEISTTLSTSFSEGGGLETARTFVLLVVFIIAGGFVQKWGKKRFITMGHYLLAAGLLLVSFSQTYAMLIISLMITGIGSGFIEALINPLILDIKSNKSGKYLNITNAFYSLGVLISAYLFGEFLASGYSWQVIFRFASACALFMGILFNILNFPVVQKFKGTSWKMYKEILFTSGFWFFALAIFLGGGIESAFTFWSRSFVETYLKDSAREGAIAVLIFAGMMAVGRLVAGKFSSIVSLKKIMIGSAFVGIIVSAMVPVAATLTWFYFLISLAGLATACFWPTILSEAAYCLGVNSTILFVLLACAGIFGYGLIPLIMGKIGDAAGLQNGFYLIPFLFITLFFLLMLEPRMSYNESGNK